MGGGNALGEYLRARRATVEPTEAGLKPLGHRRVRGLRREEVALLAGISSDYYLRLEQGRDRHPSVSVLRSLARVLCLDPVATQHLLSLGGTDNTVLTSCDDVPSSIRHLLDAMTLPAFVHNKHLDVVAANRIAQALSSTLVPGRNRLLDMFLDAEERALFVSWSDAIEDLVAALRRSVAADVHDARTVQLESQLAHDPDFARLWARHDVRTRVDRPPVRLMHPVVGELELTRDNLAVDGPGHLRLVVYHAAPGTPSAERLAAL